MSANVIFLVEDNPDNEALVRPVLQYNNIRNRVALAQGGEGAPKSLFGIRNSAGRNTDRERACNHFPVLHPDFRQSSAFPQSQKPKKEQLCAPGRVFLRFCSIKTNKYALNQDAESGRYCLHISERRTLTAALAHGEH